MLLLSYYSTPVHWCNLNSPSKYIFDEEKKSFLSKFCKQNEKLKKKRRNSSTDVTVSEFVRLA